MAANERREACSIHAFLGQNVGYRVYDLQNAAKEDMGALQRVILDEEMEARHGHN